MHFASKIKSLKNDILGKSYSLSIAFVTPAKSREINKKYRKKDKATNVLSFSLRKGEGELVLCRALIKKEAKNLGKTFEEWLEFLVIHGMLHLKGYAHSSRMDRAQDFYLGKYDKKYFNRDRRGLRDDKSRGGRVRKGRKKS